MAEGKDLLRLDLAVGDYTHQGGHKYGHDALHRKEPFDLGAQTYISEITAERSQICTPDREFQKIHQDELDGDGFYFHKQIWLNTQI